MGQDTFVFHLVYIFYSIGVTFWTKGDLDLTAFSGNFFRELTLYTFWCLYAFAAFLNDTMQVFPVLEGKKPKPAIYREGQDVIDKTWD